MSSRLWLVLSVVLCFAAFLVPQSRAENGKVSIHVTPRQAYIFVDGQALSEASKHHTLSLAAGEHKIEFANYGYAPEIRTINVTAGQTTSLDLTLQPVSGTVSGPFGAITIEGAQHDAVLLNGKSPDYFVGHGDEFNHDWWWKQELVVPAGTHQLSIMSGDKEVWSASVEVPANKRVVIDVPKGVRKTVDWPRGAKLNSVPRFTAGTASATVAIAKPTAQLSATTAQLNCGDSSQLKWSATDAPHVEISGVGPVSATGDQSVQPTQTTTYNLTATGPGGTATSTATVNVNNAVQADLSLSNGEIHYKRVGDKVVQEDSTALTWSAANASKISIDPWGTVDANGNRTLQPAPKKMDPGAVDETVTYTLTASNACGGSDTKTATLHIVGSIEQPVVELTMRSVYFPTNKPRRVKSDSALLASERESLKSIAEAFKAYLSANPNAKLVLSGHADRRGPASYNQSLSERRAELAKKFLVEQGIPEGNLETHAYGKTKNLTVDEVRALLEKNTMLTPDERQKVMSRINTIVLANNRRVDITLSTTGQESARTYPFGTTDYAALVDRGKPVESGKIVNASQKEKMQN
jgi:outer membrane protein OmpA-like peptidoglycan-associated protein